MTSPAVARICRSACARLGRSRRGRAASRFAQHAVSPQRWRARLRARAAFADRVSRRIQVAQRPGTDASGFLRRGVLRFGSLLECGYPPTIAGQPLELPLGIHGRCAQSAGAGLYSGHHSGWIGDAGIGVAVISGRAEFPILAAIRALGGRVPQLPNNGMSDTKSGRHRRSDSEPWRNCL